MSEEVQPTSSSPVTLAASCAVGAAAWYMLLLADSAALPVDVFVSTPASTPAVALSAWDSSVCSFAAAWVFGLLPLLIALREVHSFLRWLLLMASTSVLHLRS